MEFENIIFEVADRVAKITINRPPPNIIDIKTLREMIQAMEAVKKRKGIKAVIITATPQTVALFFDVVLSRPNV